jgi:uncharacterized protein
MNKLSSRAVAEANEILRGIVGSTAHGTGVDGEDDRDEMAVFVEPAMSVCGLNAFDHFIYRDKPNGVRSAAGDLDLTFYSLRKYCRLAVKGNPTVLLLLWLPGYLKQTDLGKELVGHRELFFSGEIGERFLGYLVNQRKKLIGERARNVSRPELVARYGYDTKFAMHALRLGYQGIEYVRHRQITIPVPEPERSVLRGVRQGLISYDEAVALIDKAEAELRALAGACNASANYAAIDRFLVAAHTRHWASR